MANYSIKTTTITLLLIIFTFISISSCNQFKEKKEIPKELIPKEQFIDIMVDVRMAETSIRQKISRGSNATESTDYYYSYIFKKHEVTPSQFDISLKYYSENIKEMQDINIKVVEILTQMESEVKAQKKAE